MYRNQRRRSAAQLICVFVFAYAKSQFSHDKAHYGSSKFYEDNLVQELEFFKVTVIMLFTHIRPVGQHTHLKFL